VYNQTKVSQQEKICEEFDEQHSPPEDNED
jgi:hypothetical protein